ncbi:SDR family oxidoreductase [Aquihabitans sp. G128]|uniref:SDR family NAD(P)-dependent oxidoreductase n=1 Tax=Aquihabitans sp. G128 TaxID=2849779 RepID=UPI001C2157F9|nr:SDR family oxidoreductase [Aquihabitans sp. G128]QXC62449.1 SDR family oxidoreductase [Aquihabitans sp. G128]
MRRDELLGRFDLTERTVVVTGGSRGIGRAMVLGFAALGANVVVASRKAEACDATVAEVEAEGGTALAVPTHVGDLDALSNLVAATVERFGGIDVVVNNAANALTQPIGSITAEAWQKSTDANVRAGLFLVQDALPHLIASDHAAVINLVSCGIFTSGQGMAMYLAGKSAVMSLTRSMAAELARHQIRVNALAPGVIDTDMVRNNPPEFQQLMIAGQPMGRMGQPDELVPAAAFLASDASSFMTGQCLVVDGGQTTH